MNETIALIRKNEDTGAQEQKTATSYDQARAFLDEWEQAELNAAVAAPAAATAAPAPTATPAAPTPEAKAAVKAAAGTGASTGRMGGERAGPGAMKRPVAKAKKAAKRKR